MDNKIGERIKVIMKNEGLKNPEFGGIIGVSHTTVASYIAGESSPNYEVVFNIAESFPSYSRMWIFTGEGEMKGSNKVMDSRTFEKRMEDLEKVVTILSIDTPIKAQNHEAEDIFNTLKNLYPELRHPKMTLRDKDQKEKNKKD